MGVRKLLVYIGAGILAGIIVWALPIENYVVRIIIFLFLFWVLIFPLNRLLKSKLSAAWVLYKDKMKAAEGTYGSQMREL